MKKILVTLVLFLLLITCSKKEDGITVHFWAFGGTNNMMKWAKERVALYNETHTQIKVIQSQKSWNMIRELLYTNFSTQKGPDVMRVHASYAYEFGAGGHFYPINKFPDFEQVKSWYVPHLFESTRYQDNYYGLPGTAIAFVLVCNKELFDKEGLTPPKTWSEFRDVAKKLTKDLDGDGAIDQWGLVLMGGDRGGFSYRLAPFMFKAGVEFLSPDLTTATFNTPRAVEALQLFADMYQIDKSITPGFLAYTLSEVNDLFCGNKVAMSIEGPWFSGLVAEKRPGKCFYTVPVPVPDDRIDQYQTAPTLQDMVMIAISNYSKNPEAAWEVAKYLRGPEADMAWVQRDMGGMPTTIQAWNSPEAKNFHDLAVFENELKYAKPWPSHPQMIVIAKNVIAPYGLKGIIGELTPQQALDRAVAEAQAMLDGRK
jgi:multiple sugar transport system substrate-binding protein